MRRPIHFAEQPRRNYLPLAITALAVLTIFACDRSEPEQRTTSATNEPVVVNDPVVDSPVQATTPSYENVTYEEAESTFTSRRYGEATEMFASYVSRRPQNPWGHYMLGLSAWKAGQLPRARESFERAIELDPSHVKSLLNLTRVLLDMRSPARPPFACLRPCSSTPPRARRIGSWAACDRRSASPTTPSHRIAPRWRSTRTTCGR
jgi:tetratricopeptide (TPR) repeat protein